MENEKTIFTAEDFRQGIVYKYTCPEGKIYIGQTINEKDRKRLHKCLTINENNSFKIAIKKFGFDNLKYEVLFRSKWTVEITELKSKIQELEKHYIKEFQSSNPLYGYNCTLGGDLDCIRTVGLSEISLKKMSKAQDSKKKKVGKYSLDNILLETYESIESASSSITTSSGNKKTISKKISGVVNGYKQTAYGFIWKVIED